MPWFKSKKGLRPSVAASPIESLESRTLFAATPATVTLTVPGPIPTQEIAGVVVNDKIGVNIADNDAVKAHGRVTIALFLSTDTAFSSDDVQIQPATSSPINITSGHNHTYFVKVKSFPQNLNGSFYVIAETTGAVNPATASSTTTTAVEQPVKDLSGSVAKTPPKGHVGHRIPISVSVLDTGNIQVKGKLPVAFALSATTDGANAVSLGSLTTNINLKPGQSRVLHFSVPLALGAPTGNQYVVATVDPSNVFTEPNLADNTAVGLLPVSIT